MVRGKTKALIPYYRIEWSDQFCTWACSSAFTPELETAKLPRPITTHEPLSFDIIAPSRALDEVLLMLVKESLANSPSLWCELTDASGKLLACSRVDPGSAADTGFCKILDLRGLPFSIGTKYCVRLSAPLTSNTASPAAWVVTSEPGRFQLLTDLISFRKDRTFVEPRHRTDSEDGSAPRCAVAFPAGPSDYLVRAALRLVEESFPNQPFRALELDAATAYWPILQDMDVVIFAQTQSQILPDSRFDELCFALQRRGVCTVFLNAAGLADPGIHPGIRYLGSLDRRMRASQEAARRCHFTISSGAPRTLRVSANDPDGADKPALLDQPDVLAKMAELCGQRAWPRVAIVSLLHLTEGAIDLFLDHVMKQTYRGEITVILIDDDSAENDLVRARLYQARLEAASVPNRRIVVERHATNPGNRAARLAGLAAHEADIYVMIDCDCLLNREFVSSHVFEHARPQVDLVMGLTIESEDRNPTELVKELERNPSTIGSMAELPDPTQPNGFVNCGTRNFSIKHRCLAAEPLFDIQFGSSGCGLGWEGVEMGYRLYARGASIQSTSAAFAVRCPDAYSAEEPENVADSIDNFDRLFVKHPDMALVARRWAVDTYEKLVTSPKEAIVDGTDAECTLASRFGPLLEQRKDLIPLFRGKQRPLRILSYRWHVSHQYELHKLPHSFTLATGWEHQIVNHWGYDERPLRPNVRFLPAAQVDPRDFDLAILHFDENVLDPALTNGVVPPTWGDPFRWLLGIPALPKIAICHGTPQFAGQFALDPSRKAVFEIYEEQRQRLVEALADNSVHVVCNSHQSLREWGFRNARAIWHGFDPQEFPPATYQRDVLALRPDRLRPHYRGAWEHAEVERKLDPGIRIETAEHAGAPLEIRNTNAFAVANFRSYVDRIRQFTVYLNTTLRSPMPRARGEAMMTGLVPVCLNNHDVELFIDRGVNGFYADEPGELADFINYLFRNREAARSIGLAARRTALDIFNHDRHLIAWARLINEVVHGIGASVVLPLGAYKLD
jgi:glycosyltransferase involved in cell wall biosynthesis